METKNREEEEEKEGERQPLKTIVSSNFFSSSFGYALKDTRPYTTIGSTPPFEELLHASLS